MRAKHTLIAIAVAFSITTVLGMVLTTFQGYSKIAYVESQQLFENFKGTQELNKDLSALQQRHKHVLDSLEMEIGQTNPNDLSTLQASQIQRYKKLETAFESEELEKSQNYTSQLRNQINQYLEEYGKSAPYDLILGVQGTGNVVYAKEATNITTTLITYINQQYEGE